MENNKPFFDEKFGKDYKVKFKFEKLTIWRQSMRFGEEVYEMTKSFPKEEMYSLTSQFRRSSDSVALNIAEGCIGQSNLEQRKFTGYSIRSLAEAITCLYKAYLRNYISKKQFEELYDDAFYLMNATNAFKNSIKI